jgi:hypothetical protein
MAATYVLIASQVLGSTATSVTFSSIPGTYTDLVIKTSARDSTGGNNTDNINVAFNGTTSTYGTTFLRGNSSVSDSFRDTSQIYTRVVTASTGTAWTANTFASSEIYIPNYATSSAKQLLASVASENNSSAANGAFIIQEAGYWSSGAITSITLTNGAVTFAIGSSFYLYGISNA